MGSFLKRTMSPTCGTDPCFFPGDDESPSGVFLLPERVEEVVDNFPPWDLLSWVQRNCQRIALVWTSPTEEVSKDNITWEGGGRGEVRNLDLTILWPSKVGGGNVIAPLAGWTLQLVVSQNPLYKGFHCWVKNIPVKKQFWKISLITHSCKKCLTPIYSLLSLYQSRYNLLYSEVSINRSIILYQSR